MPKMRVLLVDDEIELVSALQERMELRDIDADYVLSGPEALKRVKMKAYDIAVVDVTMPEMNGLEVLENLKKIQPDIQVILLTGRATLEDSKAGLAKGAFDYLIKPVKLSRLIKLMNDALEPKNEG